MKIQVFAILKDYFNETFELEGSGVTSVQQLKQELIKMNQSVAPVLSSCRFAVNEEFVSDDFQLKENEQVYVIPPSSGG